MMESDNKLRHMLFFEEIATLEENSDAWHAATAGLVTLRLVDAWLGSGAGHAADDEWNFRGVCATVEKVSERTLTRQLLTSVLVALRDGKPNVRAVVPSLMAYAQSLEYEAKWSLASDVYDTLLGHLHPTDDADASIAAQLRLGTCHRHLNRIDDAVRAFAAASEIGNAVGDMEGILRARLGEARIAILHGNLPQAEVILDETIAAASKADLRDVRSRALHDRSEVARLDSNYELAIRLAYEALHLSQVKSERDRILGDIAAAFLSLGVYSAARDAYLVLSVTAQEQYVRWTSMLNLLEVSSLTGEELLFAQHQKQLLSESLPPYLETVYQINLGQGYHRLGAPETAHAHLVLAKALAEEHQLHRLFFIVEESLTGLQRATPLHRLSSPAPMDVKEVATALQGLREAVGV